MAIRFPRLFGRTSVSLLLIGALTVLSACRTDRVMVDRDDPRSPQYAYRLDQLALLRMAADDIMELERRKQYSKIYDDFGSDAFKKSVSRRHFLIMSNCVETWLGSMLEYDSNDLGFRRETLKDQPNRPLEVLNREVSRIRGNIEEQLVFVESGLKFKLNGMYWVTKDKQFMQCIADSARIEASTQPSPVLGGDAPAAETPPAVTPPSETPASPETPEQPAGTEPGPSTGMPAAEPAKPAKAEPAKPAKVDELKPAEVKKDTIHARPAGAGALKDTRPQTEKPEAKPAEKPAAPAEPPAEPKPMPVETPADDVE